MFFNQFLLLKPDKTRVNFKGSIKIYFVIKTNVVKKWKNVKKKNTLTFELNKKK